MLNFFDFFSIQRVFTISRLIYLRFIFIIEKIVRRNEMDNNLDNNQADAALIKGIQEEIRILTAIRKIISPFWLF